MADEEQLAILRQGVEAWNAWRKQSPNIRPDIRGADLAHANLTRADFRHTDFTGACFFHADLSYSDLVITQFTGADLRHANLASSEAANINLIRADLACANLMNTDLIGAKLTHSNLTKVKLNNSRIVRADFTSSILDRAELDYAVLIDTELSFASFVRARLRHADFVRANLCCTDLSYADFSYANFTDAHLTSANFNMAILQETILADVDLSQCEGLEQCRCLGPSTIDHRTLQRSGPLPLTFLRGVGLPENLIDYLPSLLNQPIQWYSCFISYSAKDEDFARRLHADLQAKGVRCWFAPEDMKIGAKVLDTIDQAIRLREGAARPLRGVAGE